MEETDPQALAEQRAVEFLNAHLGDDIESLSKAPDLLKEVTETKQRLEAQLLGVTSQAPLKFDQSAREAAAATQAVERLKGEREELVGDIQNHLVDAGPLERRLAALTAQVDELEKFGQYLLCVSHFEDLSADIQSALLISSVERAVAQFVYMAQLAKDLRQSKCCHLVSFTQNTVVFWHKILTDRISSEFDECMRAWQWPFIISSIKPTPVANAAELRDKLGPLFHLLTQLQIADGFLPPASKLPSESALSTTECRPIPLPIQLLAKPFRTRFAYHFRGNQPTNNRDKPEWFFTQILSWIRDHREFLSTRIQTELDTAAATTGCHKQDAVIQFARSLVTQAADKLLTDLPAWLEQEQEASFAHLVDETLSFQRELSESYAYPEALPGCLHVLMQREPFRVWIDIERKFALEKMDAMLSSPAAWRPLYKDISDVDELKMSECGETFMTLILTITDRYKLLPSTSHRFQFVQLQLDLLDDYRIRLVQISRRQLGADPSPLHPDYCSVLNTVSYIGEVVRRWANLPFFVQLQYYKQQTEVARRSGENSTTVGGDAPEGDTSPLLELTADSLVELEGSLFDDVVALLDLMRGDMLQNVLKFVVDDVKARSRPYRKDKWLALPSQKDYISLALSSSACELLHVLKERLCSTEHLLSRALFSELWQGLAAELNTFVYREVILANSFNEGGAVQLQFDMTRNLFPLFAAYTTKPENYFKDVKEACMVLTLTPGSALLIKDVLYRALHEPRTHHSSQVTDPIATIQDIGIYKLGMEEVELLLSLRIDLQA